MKSIFKSMLLCLVLGVFVATATTIQAEAKAVTQIAKVTSKSVKIYKKPSATSKYVLAKATHTNRAYYAREYKKVKNVVYYRLEKGATSIGWVKKADLSLYNRTILSKKQQTVFLLGTGYASTMPRETSQNRSYELANYRFKTFTATRYEKVGTQYWYKGYIEGKKKLRWVRAADVTTNGYLTVNLRKPSGVTVNDLRALLLAKNKTKDNVLYKLAPDFVAMEKKTGVSAQFMFAHAILETGWGSSKISQYKNNLFGFQAYDSCAMTCAKYFNDGEEALQGYVYKIYRDYLTPTGAYYKGPTPYGMNTYYASDKSWSEKIAGLMQQIKPYNVKHYANAKASTKVVEAQKEATHVIPVSLPQPDTYIAMPASMNVKAAAGGTTIYKLPYVYGGTLGSYKKDQQFKLIAYHTDVYDFVGKNNKKSRWYRISYNNTQGWIRSDAIVAKNLFFTKVQAHLRTGAGTTYASKRLVAANHPLKAVTKDGKIVAKKAANKALWYQVYDPKTNAKYWVSKSNLTTYN